MSEHNPQVGGAPLPLRRQQELPPGQQRAAELVRQLEPTAPLSEISVARIRRRLDAALSSGGRFRIPRWLRLTVAAAASLFMLELAAAATLTAWPAMRHHIASLVYGRMRPGSPAVPSSAPPDSTTVPEVPSRSPPIAPSMVPPAAGTAAAGSDAPAQGTAPSHGGTQSPPAALLRHPRSEITVDRSSVSEETGALAQALVQLHARHDPEGALAKFEVYGFEHPNGSLRGEAAVGQIEALLALDRNAEALALLEAMQRRSFAGLPRASSLRLLHAELLGKLGRCADAVPVLTDYLAPSIPAQERERALLARASCRAAMGDHEGSRADLQSYLNEFPNGTFASRVLLELGRSP